MDTPGAPGAAGGGAPGWRADPYDLLPPGTRARLDVRAGSQVPEPREQGDAGAARPRDRGAEGPPGPPGQAGPACVMIMWGDGTVTTVRPPEAPPAETA
jgi:hypothetical protein